MVLKPRVLFAFGVPARGLAVMIRRGKMLGSQAEVQHNKQQLWALLSNATPLPPKAGLSPVARGWVALARIEQTAWERPDKFNQRIEHWRAQWPGHPANGALLAQILAAEQARFRYPPVVAFLLPLSGPYAEQGRAVEAGLLAAYYHSAEPRPKI